MSHNTLSVLAKSVQATFPKPQVYGRLRSKLDKQGFSEIAIYKAVADHCDENFIEPSNMVNETVELMEGLARNINFLATSNLFPSLRGQFHQLRHGNTKLDEPKSAEQKGKYLCNMCHQIKGKEDRSKAKSYKNSCTVCVSQKVKATAQINKPVEQPVRDLPVQDEPIQAQVIEQPEVVVSEPEMTTTSIKIVEVMADSETANVSITCSPKDLHILLSALSDVTA